MNTETNTPRIRIERGIVAYIPLPFGKGLTVTPAETIREMFSIRSREWALYDYADYGVKSYDLLVAMTSIEKAA